MNKRLQHIIIVLSVFGNIAFALAQRENTSQTDLQKMRTYDKAVELADKYATKGRFNESEAAYKTAIAMQPENVKAIYNLGNLYYDENRMPDAVKNYQKSIEKAVTKEDKHRVYHNLGNVFLKNKQYDAAIAAYKQSLRNDPTDDETRYNLALAKREKEKNGGGGGDDGKNKDKNNGNGNDQKQDKKEGDKDKNSDGKNKGDQNKKDGNDQDDGDGDKKDSNKGKNTEGDNGDGKPNDNTGGKAPQRVEGKLTPQQVKQLLDAMNNEEQKVQGKIKGKKVPARANKNEKDW